jgi:hypothetical protein
MIFIAQDSSVCQDQTTTNNRSLKFALNYAAQMGWTVFPVEPGTKKSRKAKRFCGGVNWGATRDPKQITKDFIKWRGDNIGIPCGKDNRIFVIDADTVVGHNVDGVASLRNLEATYGALPITLVAISPSGSQHYYFRYPSDMEVRDDESTLLGAGIDIRGEGGMVLAPPSVKPGVGIYRWHHIAPIADAPDWLLEKVRYRPPPTPSFDPVALIDRLSRLSNQDLYRLGNALEQIPANCCYKVRYQVLTALKNEGNGTDIFKGLAYDWCCTLQGDTAKDFESQWQRIKENTYNYSLGTIYFFAKNPSLTVTENIK